MKTLQPVPALAAMLLLVHGSSACGDASTDGALDTFDTFDTSPDAVSGDDAFPDTASDPAAWAQLDAPPTPSVALIVGTGTTTFQPLGDPPVFLLERGTQGLQHIWIALRAPLPRAFHRVTLALGTPGDSLVEPFQQNIPFSTDGPPEAPAQALGVLLVVADAERATARAAWDLHIRLDSAAGAVARVTLPVRIAWP
jgi:hypothetical protein